MPIYPSKSSPGGVSSSAPSLAFQMIPSCTQQALLGKPENGEGNLPAHELSLVAAECHLPPPKPLASSCGEEEAESITWTLVLYLPAGFCRWVTSQQEMPVREREGYALLPWILLGVGFSLSFLFSLLLS